MKNSYASIHAHTEYSNIKIIDSINKVEELIDRAYDKGLHAIAITDHDTLSGHVRAIKHFKSTYQDKDFKLILGNEIYLTREGLSSDNYEKGEKFYHLLLLAKDAVGHKQLRQLSSRAWDRMFIRGVMRTPTYMSDLEEIVGGNPGHLMCTTACLGGVPGAMFAMKGDKAAPDIEAWATKMEGIFGKNHFYLEVQPSHQPQQIDFNAKIIEWFWGKFPFVFTSDVHYLDFSDRNLHETFLKSKESERDTAEYYTSAYLMDIDEIHSYFDAHISPDKIEAMRLNTIAIADMVETYDLKNKQIVPSVPSEMTEELEEVAVKFAEFWSKKIPNRREFPYIKKYFNDTNIVNKTFVLKVLKGFYELVGIPTQDYLKRLENEFEQLWEISETIGQPIANYFLTMAKMIDIIWEDGDSLVGVSRGSAAGFLINYCLGITQLDPTKQMLEMPYWRFLHKDRPDLPDIDIDTEGSKRVKVFNKVREYFQSIGGDVINVSTFGTEKAKAALRTASRGLDVNEDIVSYAISLIPNERGFDWTLQQCMVGDETHFPIAAFQKIMRDNRRLWEVASRLEGLITHMGVHAAGVIPVNEDFTNHNSLMRTSNSVVVSAYNLEDTEYLGGLKYDFLTINGLDKIRTTMNLLLEDGHMEWKGGLRKTYNHYLLPKNLEYDDPKMWEMAHKNQVVDLFQFDTPVGGQAVRSIKPENVAELAIANSLMRLMKQDEADEMPVETFIRNKNDIRNWQYELKKWDLSPEEIEVLEKYLLPLSGVADSQESVMMITMDPRVANFDVVEANVLRKAIAKKKADVLEKARGMFFEKGLLIGTTQRMLDYVWEVQIGRQIGYSFSVLHTMGYSTIALQEMNLAFKYPILYWNTACLTVNAGAINEEDYLNLIEDGIVELSDIEDMRKSNKVQYGKVAAAIGKFRDDLGLRVDLPNINIARFGFTPNLETNSIVFGLKAVSRVGDDIIRAIIENRPYASMVDFLDKMNGGTKKIVPTDRMVNLIKAGAFDQLEGKPREEIMKDYIGMISGAKDKLNMQNFNSLIENDMVPQHLDGAAKFYKFMKYVRTTKFQEYYILDEAAQDYYFEQGFDSNEIKYVKEMKLVSQKYLDAEYDRKMNDIREWLTIEQDKMVKAYNEKIMKNNWDKYASGDILTWELDALNFYHTGHELKDMGPSMPIVVSPVNIIPDNEMMGTFNIQGKIFPKYNIRHIIGTVLDSDKMKHLITLSTPEGIIMVKVYRSQYAVYDKIVSRMEDGVKIIDEDSFFKKGTFLLISGIKRGEYFVPKVYKKMDVQPIMRIAVDQNKKFVNAYGRV